MVYGLVGIVLGIIAGLYLPFKIPSLYSAYMSIALLAAIDSVFGGIKTLLQNRFDNLIFITGFITNTLLAAILAYMGDIMGVPLYLAAIFAFGVRIFQNLAIIRHKLLEKFVKESKNCDKKKENRF